MPQRTVSTRMAREHAMMSAMPLSEHEQRILRQIEQQLEQDPTFAARGYRVARAGWSC